MAPSSFRLFLVTQISTHGNNIKSNGVRQLDIFPRKKGLVALRLAVFEKFNRVCLTRENWMFEFQHVKTRHEAHSKIIELHFLNEGRMDRVGIFCLEELTPEATLKKYIFSWLFINQFATCLVSFKSTKAEQNSNQFEFSDLFLDLFWYTSTFYSMIWFDSDVPFILVLKDNPSLFPLKIVGFLCLVYKTECHLTTERILTIEKLLFRYKKFEKILCVFLEINFCTEKSKFSLLFF